MSTYLKHVDIIKVSATKLGDLSFDSPIKNPLYHKKYYFVSFIKFEKIDKVSKECRHTLKM